MIFSLFNKSDKAMYVAPSVNYLSMDVEDNVCSAASGSVDDWTVDDTPISF
ncbi:MAG: hypothetical protein K5984_07105 [Bacteroidales bacterium]|nr:hypothetical protein [Bacteroidales bacterium]